MLPPCVAAATLNNARPTRRGALMLNRQPCTATLRVINIEKDKIGEK